MYIRRQKQRYQLIRTEYCAAKKRGRQKLLGSLCAKNPSVSSIDLSKLTEQEREELNAFLVKHDREASPERLEAFLSALKDFEQYLAATNAVDDLRSSETWKQVSDRLEGLTTTMRSRRPALRAAAENEAACGLRCRNHAYAGGWPLDQKDRCRPVYDAGNGAIADQEATCRGLRSGHYRKD